jgi:hypothetical protein
VHSNLFSVTGNQHVDYSTLSGHVCVLWSLAFWIRKFIFCIQKHKNSVTASHDWSVIDVSGYETLYPLVTFRDINAFCSTLTSCSGDPGLRSRTRDLPFIGRVFVDLQTPSVWFRGLWVPRVRPHPYQLLCWSSAHSTLLQHERQLHYELLLYGTRSPKSRPC